MNEIRYYKGKYRVELLIPESQGKKFVVRVIDPIPFPKPWENLPYPKFIPSGTILLCPARLCWRERKRGKTYKVEDTLESTGIKVNQKKIN